PGGPYSVGHVAETLRRRIRGLTPGHPAVRLTRRTSAGTTAAAPGPVLSLAKGRSLLLIGASTGGTQAIESLLTRLPADTPPILIVKHMPAGSTEAFARRLDTVCPMKVVEAKGGEALQRGVAYIAPGDYHLEVDARGLDLRTAIRSGEPVHYQRPAVDVLFQ